MEDLNCLQHLSKKNFRLVNREILQFLNVMEQFSSGAQVKHQAVVIPRSESIVQLYNKWLLQSCENITFAENLLKP